MKKNKDKDKKKPRRRWQLMERHPDVIDALRDAGYGSSEELLKAIRDKEAAKASADRRIQDLEK